MPFSGEGFWGILRRPLVLLPDLPFLGVLAKTKENHPKHQGFFTPPDPSQYPRKTEKNCRKHSKDQGISLVRKDQGKSKHQGMEDQGWPLCFIADPKRVQNPVKHSSRTQAPEAEETLSGLFRRCRPECPEDSV